MMPADQSLAAVQAWSIGEASADARTGVVAYTFAELQAGWKASVPCVAFHDVACGGDVTRGEAVRIVLPRYRGKSFVRLLAWLVSARLAVPGAEAIWVVDRSQGPKAIVRLLAESGWQTEVRRAGRSVELTSVVPEPATTAPQVSAFVADLAGKRVRLDADFGVFSPTRVDPGTALLLAAALDYPKVETLADIGVGYGALGIGMSLHGRCRRVVGSDVDSVALWLAVRNANSHGVALDVWCSADPCDVPSSELTLCNVPTHITAADTRAMMDSLTQRADGGDLLIVVHASLQGRYEKHLLRAGLTVRERRQGEANHVVLAAGKRR
jgi:16S rRNA G1207 methylase RsmC